MTMLTVTPGPEPKPAGRYRSTWIGQVEKEGEANGEHYRIRIWTWQAEDADGQPVEIEIATSTNLSTASKGYAILAALVGHDIRPGESVDLDAIQGTRGWLTITLANKKNGLGKKNEFAAFERIPGTTAVPF